VELYLYSPYLSSCCAPGQVYIYVFCLLRTSFMSLVKYANCFPKLHSNLRRDSLAPSASEVLPVLYPHNCTVHGQQHLSFVEIIYLLSAISLDKATAPSTHRRKPGRRRVVVNKDSPAVRQDQSDDMRSNHRSILLRFG